MALFKRATKSRKLKMTFYAMELTNFIYIILLNMYLFIF